MVHSEGVPSIKIAGLLSLLYFTTTKNKFLYGYIEAMKRHVDVGVEYQVEKVTVESEENRGQPASSSILPLLLWFSLPRVFHM